MKSRWLVVTLMLFLIFYAFANDRVVIPVLYGQSKTDLESMVTSEDIKGVTLAAEKINRNGGLLGRKVELVECVVTSVDMEELDAVYDKLTAVDDLFAVIGANTSGISLYFAPLLQKLGVLMISPIATNPKVTQAGDMIYRVCFTDPFQGKVMARFALEELGAGSVVILTKTTSTFSLGLSEYFKEAFEKGGGTVLAEESYAYERVDFSSILDRVKQLDPDVVFLPGHGTDSGMIIKQAEKMGIETVFLGGDGWGKGLIGFSGEEAAEGNYFSNHWHRDVDNPRSRAFVKRYYEKYGEGMIASSAPLAYDAMSILAEAVERAGSFNSREIKKELDRITDFKGVTGTFDFTRGRDPYNKEAVILKYEKGDIIYHSTVSP